MNNSEFVSIKFNLLFFWSQLLLSNGWLRWFFFQSLFSFKACFFSEHFWLSFLRRLSLSRFYFSLFFRRSRYQTKQVLAVTLLFQWNFLLVVGADNLIWQFHFYFYRILSTWCWINTKVFIGFSIPSACTQNLIADE